MKTSTILIILIIIGAGFYFYQNNDRTTSQVQNKITDNQEAEEVVNGGEETSVDGEVSYTAQKVFFSKPTEQVTGTSSDLSGDISYTDGVLNAMVSIDTESIATDSEGRDKDVVELLGSTIQAEINDVATEFPFNKEIMVDITIAGVTNTAPFQITGMLAENEIVLDATGSVNISDFGLDAPGNPNIYSVEDEIILSASLRSENM
tara:strand:- start:262 stop:876 length:615 start_codon:yes stop_codon:yes gene_type:complete